jgi:hypothetical protein
VACESAVDSCTAARILDAADPGCFCNAIGITWQPARQVPGPTGAPRWVWEKASTAHPPGRPAAALPYASAAVAWVWDDAGWAGEAWVGSDYAPWSDDGGKLALDLAQTSGLAAEAIVPWAAGLRAGLAACVEEVAPDEGVCAIRTPPCPLTWRMDREWNGVCARGRARVTAAARWPQAAPVTERWFSCDSLGAVNFDNLGSATIAIFQASGRRRATGIRRLALELGRNARGARERNFCQPRSLGGRHHLAGGDARGLVRHHVLRRRLVGDVARLALLRHARPLRRDVRRAGPRDSSPSYATVYPFMRQFTVCATLYPLCGRCAAGC